MSTMKITGWTYNAGNGWPSLTHTPAACPSGWTEADNDLYNTNAPGWGPYPTAGSYTNAGAAVRTCISNSPRSVLAMTGWTYNAGNGWPSLTHTPAACPPGWTEAGNDIYNNNAPGYGPYPTAGSYTYVGSTTRTCYK